MEDNLEYFQLIPARVTMMSATFIIITYGVGRTGSKSLQNFPLLLLQETTQDDMLLHV